MDCTTPSLITRGRRIRVENSKPKVSHGHIIHKGKKYTYTITELNSPSKEAIENCNRYINNLMNNLYSEE